MTIRYAEDKPKFCGYCYFRHDKKRNAGRRDAFIGFLKSHPLRIRHTGFGFYAKAVSMEKIPVLAIAWLKF